jgi:hypothetical protein
MPAARLHPQVREGQYLGRTCGDLGRLLAYVEGELGVMPLPHAMVGATLVWKNARKRAVSFPFLSPASSNVASFTTVY